MFSKTKKPFSVYMAETKQISRYDTVRIALFGAFLGVCFATVYFMLANL